MAGRWWECPEGGERYALQLLTGCPRHRLPLVEHTWACPVDGALFAEYQNICTHHGVRLVDIEGGGDACLGGNSKPSKPTTGSGSTSSGPTVRLPAPNAASRGPRTRPGPAVAGSAASTAPSGRATGGVRSANPPTN